MTCAEIAAVGLPAVYVPLPWGNREQYKMAGPIVAAGGGLFCDDADISPQWIERELIPMIMDAPRLMAMGEAAGAFGRRHGDEALRELTLRMVGATV